jgi:HPt (histidine-containing phosphotransfer) domain-containing protein
MEAQDRIAEQMNVLRKRFRSRCAERSEALLRACEKKDLPLLGSLAHDITGSAGLFGFPALSEKAQHVSELCREPNDEEAFAAGQALAVSLKAVASEGD